MVDAPSRAETQRPAPAPGPLEDFLDRGSVAFLPDDGFRFAGRTVRVRTNSPVMRDHLRSMYGRFLLRGDLPDSPAACFEILDRLERTGEMLVQDDQRSYRLVRTRGVPLMTCRDRSSREVLVEGPCEPRTLLQAALLHTVAAVLEDRDLFHAGAVAIDGAGIVLAASSGMGKTTLTLELVRRGCGFLSDEVACIHAGGRRLEPFPRRLNLRRESRRLLGIERGDEEEVSVDIEELYPGRIAGACRPRYLLFLQGFADEAHLERVSGAHALFELFRAAVGGPADRAARLFQYAPLLDGMESYNLVAGPLAETADLVMSLPERGPGGR